MQPKRDIHTFFFMDISPEADPKESPGKVD